jgi:hypothetical protein
LAAEGEVHGARDVDLADERAARFEHLDAAARRRVDEPVGVDLDASG